MRYYNYYIHNVQCMWTRIQRVKTKKLQCQFTAIPTELHTSISNRDSNDDPNINSKPQCTRRLSTAIQLQQQSQQ